MVGILSILVLVVASVKVHEPEIPLQIRVCVRKVGSQEILVESGAKRSETIPPCSTLSPTHIAHVVWHK